MNEWAARIMSVFPDRSKTDLDLFIQEVSNEDLERMYFQKEYVEEVECRPTFEQVSQEKIVDEATRNLIVLKSLENIIGERMNGFNAMNTNILKARPYFESFENSDCTIKLALDSMYIFVEQEIAQSKQGIFLGDLKRSLNEMRTDAQKRITDYQKEIMAAEKEVSNAEKKLQKSKEAYERGVEFRAKMEAFELDILMNSARGKSNSKKETSEDSIAKMEREMKDDIRGLLRAIGTKDQVLSASRRAFQKLDKECKKAIYFTLRKIVEKEKENALLHLEVMNKFEKTVLEIDVDNDVNEFIRLNISDTGAMELSSQALSLLSDLTPSQVVSTSPHSMSNSSTPRGSFSTPGRAPLTSSNLHTHSHSQSKDHSAAPGGGAALTAALSGTGSGGDSYSSPLRNRSTSSASSGGGSSGHVNASGMPQYHTPASKLFALENHSKHPSPPGAAAATNDELASYLTQIFYCANATSPMPDVSSTAATAGTSEHSSAGEHQDDHRVDGSAEGEDRNSLTELDHGDGHHAAKGVPRSGSTPSLTRPSPSFDDAHHPHHQLHTEEGDREPNINDRSSAEYQKYKRSSLRVLSITAAPTGATSKALEQDLEKHHTTRRSSTQPATAEEAAALKAEHRKAKVTVGDRHLDALNDKHSHSAGYGWLRSNPDPSLVEAVEWMCRAVKSQSGRDIFISELNQFRSKKVDVGPGFDALGAVLWTALSYCQSENDIHSAKILMMLSQTFYRQIKPGSPKPDDVKSSTSTDNKEQTSSSSSSGPQAGSRDSGTETKAGEEAVQGEAEEEEEGNVKRGCEHRQYIKEKLLTHPIWQDGNYWEQALWQCAIQQLQTIPYDRAWWDMDRETRAMSVRRVHDVIFSQVMAITHSMLELGCSNEQSREFLYRMCVIHQLSEAQRQQLLQHVVGSGSSKEHPRLSE